jgi:predicted nuclease of predicted toxin-antitoxin system
MRLVMRLRLSGMRVRTSRQDRVNEASAAEVCAWARRANRVLLSLDRRYWNDELHPLDQVPGILLLDFPPQDVNQAVQAFELAYQVFGTQMDAADWHGMKVLASPASCQVKMADSKGMVKEYVVTRQAGLLFVSRQAGTPAEEALRIEAPAEATPAAQRS